MKPIIEPMDSDVNGWDWVLVSFCYVFFTPVLNLFSWMIVCDTGQEIILMSRGFAVITSCLGPCVVVFYSVLCFFIHFFYKFAHWYAEFCSFYFTYSISANMSASSSPQPPSTPAAPSPAPAPSSWGLNFSSSALPTSPSIHWVSISVLGFSLWWLRRRDCGCWWGGLGGTGREACSGLPRGVWSSFLFEFRLYGLLTVIMGQIVGWLDYNFSNKILIGRQYKNNAEIDLKLAL